MLTEDELKVMRGRAWGEAALSGSPSQTDRRLLLAEVDRLRGDLTLADGAFADFLALGGPECDGRRRADERARVVALLRQLEAEQANHLRVASDAGTREQHTVEGACWMGVKRCVSAVEALGPAAPLPAARLRARVEALEEAARAARRLAEQQSHYSYIVTVLGRALEEQGDA